MRVESKMTSTKKVSKGHNHMHLIFYFVYFVESFTSFVDCASLMIIVKKPKIAYFSKLFCSTVSSRNIKNCDIPIKQV